MNKTVIRLKTKNDMNGNPRRLFVLIVNGMVKTVWDEGYAGQNSMPERYISLWKGTTFGISIGEYNSWKHSREFEQ